jgi:hypothetical protein
MLKTLIVVVERKLELGLELMLPCSCTLIGYLPAHKKQTQKQRQLKLELNQYNKHTS